MSDPGGAGAAPPASGGTTPPPPPAGSEASRSRGAAPPRAGAAASPFASAGPAVTVQWASGGSSPAPAEPSPSDDGFRSGPHLALQASLQRRPSSAAASELYPPHGGSRPTSAASHRSGASGGGGMGRAPSLHASGSRPLAPAPRPSLRGGPPSEAGSAQSAAVLLESVRSQLQEAAGPGGACECRVLLPGLDLAEHGLGELQELAAPGGGDLGVLSAPRGMDLREAMSQAYSHSQLQLEGSSALTGSASRRQLASASVPGTPASLPCALGSPAGTPLAPADWQQQQQELQQEGRQQDKQAREGRPASGGSPEQSAALQGPPAADHAAKQQQQQQAGMARPPAGPGRRQPAPTSESLEVQLPAGATAAAPPPGGQRPWSYDGTLASLAVPRSLKRTGLELEYRARAAARMWPMLAPFVPRMLRQYILQAGPPAGGLQAADSPVLQSLGRALRCRASAPAASIGRAMRPCMDAFPAALMIADVSGFTALTEALGGRGSAGVELLTKCMNRYFTSVIDLLLLYGGDVEKFAGDCMIVVFAPTRQEAEGSEDGGLAAATLRAVTCGSELASRFGAMRMLPNGEVVPVPAAERWEAEAEEARAAAAAAAGGEDPAGLRDRLEDLRDKVAAPAGKVLARGSSLVGRTASSSVKAAAAVGGGGVKAASVMGGGGVRAAAFVGGGVAATAQATAYTAHTVVARAVQPLQLSPPRLPGRGTRATKSDAHLPVAASPPPAVGEAAADSQPSAGGMQRLMRVHSSPDASLDVGVAPPEGEAGAAQPPARPPHKAPVRALLRQSSSVAAAVLSRLSRSSGSTASRRQRSTLGQSAQHAEQSLEDAAEAAVAAVEAERAAGAAPEAGQAARRSSIQPAASAPVLDRQQQERRMHEQALAGLALLAGPAGALRPPELPSASGAAEVAELRLQEQLAMYQHRRKPSLPQDWEQRMSAAAPPLPDASTSSVLRTSTAPPAVTAHLARVAAEHRRQQQQQPQQEQQQQQPLPPQQQQPEGPQKPAEQAMPCVLGLESAEDTVGPTGPSTSLPSSGGTSATEPQRACGAPLRGGRKPLPAVPSGVSFGGGGGEPLAPLQAMPPVAGSGELSVFGSGAAASAACATAPTSPLAAAEPAGAVEVMAPRPSVLRRLFSMPGRRGRSVSGAVEAPQVPGGTDGCQSSATSMRSAASVGPWAASLAELSSGLGLPGSVTSQRVSPSSASRRGRRSLQNRRSSSSWPWSPGMGAGLGGMLSASYSTAQPAPSGPSAAQSASPFQDAAAASGPASPDGPDTAGSDADAGEPPQPAPAAQVLLSLKVMVSAGSVCAFHVGGGHESGGADDAAGVPRWEFFLGDPPQPEAEAQEGTGGNGRPRPPIAQLQAAERHALSGQTVLSPEAAALVGAACELEPLGADASRLLQVLQPYELPAAAAEEAAAPSLERAARQVARERASLATLPEAAQGHALQLLRMHLLENVRVRVEAGHFDFINELRVGTVLFLGFPSLLEPAPAGATRTGLAAVQACLEAVQKRMRQHDGSFLQFRCDEKGFLAICAFGLPGRSHEDGPARGIQAALAIVEAVRRRGGRACCGVTTGHLFCAMVGSQRRSEYTVFGNAINLSARLMVRARDRGADVYCDATTQQLARHKAVYQRLDPVRVKGRQLPVDIFEVTSLHAEGRPGARAAAALSPLGPQPLAPPPALAEAAAAAAAGGLGSASTGAVGAEAELTLAPQLAAEPGAGSAGPQGGLGAGAGAAAGTAPGGGGTDGLLGMGDRLLSIASTSAAPVRLLPSTAPMIGREAELGAITARCVELVRARRGGVVLVEGEAGMGKTRLVEELQHSELGGVYDGCNLFVGLGRRERKGQALYPWRRVLREMFHHDRQLGGAYCLRGTDAVVVATELALRLREGVPDYAAWRHLLADALELPLSEFPPALQSLQQHRQWLVEQQRITPSTQLRGPTPEPLDALPSGLDAAAAHPGGLGADEAAFLSGSDRARSFAARMKRSASLTTAGLLAQSSNASAAAAGGGVKALLRAGTPSPRKMAALRQRHETFVFGQAQAMEQQHAAGAGGHSRHSSEDEDGEEQLQPEVSGYSSSDGGSYASRASSFSVHSTHGSPTSAHASALGDGSEPGGASAAAPSGSSWGRLSGGMQRAATSRGGVGLALRPSSPGREISTHLRAKKVQELVCALIRQFTEAYGPLVLVLEDLHHFDTASWRLLTHAVTDPALRETVLFVLTYRPHFGALAPVLRQRGGSRELLYHRVQAAYRALLAQPSTLHLRLQPFDLEQSRRFVSASLGDAHVPPEVAAMLWERSSGLPSFLEQLVVFLQSFVNNQLPEPALAHAASAGAGGRASAFGLGLSLALPPAPAPGLGARRNPTEEVAALAHAGLQFIANNLSISSIVTDRVDRLRPEEQLTLKAASVLGLTVYAQLLQATHPQRPPPAALEASLCALEAAAFLRQDPLEPATWRFCQVLARDVVYELVPKETRRDWHAAAAAAMEAYSAGQIHLPASTIAWHWAQSCKDVEAPQWQRSLRAVAWWQRAAASALDNGAYADALPLMQKAQDVAEALERYFALHSRSFWLMRRQQTAEAGGAALLEASGLPLGLAAGSTLPEASMAALLSGSLLGPGTSDLPDLSAALPLVPRVRRAHWERCMAAMCVAVELSAESLHEAKTHCLLALYLLGVPLPSSEEYMSDLERRHWWPQDGPLAWLSGAAQRAGAACSCGGQQPDPLERRAAELEGGAYAWMARPAEVVGETPAGGAQSMTPSLPESASVQQWQPLAASSADVASSGSTWPQPAGLGGASTTLTHWSAGASGGPPGAASLAPVPLVPSDAQQQQQPQMQPQRPPVTVVRLPPGTAPSLLQPSPFELPAAAQAASGGGGAGGAMPSLPTGASSAARRSTGSSVLASRPTRTSASLRPGTSAAARGSAGSAALGSHPAVVSCVGTLGVAPSGQPSLPHPQASAAAHSLASQQFRLWEAAGLQAAAAASAQPGGGPAPAAQPSQALGGDEFNSLSVLPTASGPADLGGPSYERQSLAATRRRQTAQRAAMVALGGDEGGARHPAEVRAEACLVLDLLCALLLAPQPGGCAAAPPDAAGLRYVRWACRHLQGGRVTRRSPYWPAYRDAGLALQRSQKAAAGRGTQPQAQPQPPEPSSRRSGSGGDQLLSALSVPQTLAAIAGAVAGAFSTEGRSHRGASGSSGGGDRAASAAAAGQPAAARSPPH